MSLPECSVNKQIEDWGHSSKLTSHALNPLHGCRVPEYDLGGAGALVGIPGDDDACCAQGITWSSCASFCHLPVQPICKLRFPSCLRAEAPVPSWLPLRTQLLKPELA